MNTILPVRCYTCGKVLGHLADKYDKLLEEGKTTEEAMDELQLVRYCCRMNVFNPIVLPRHEFDHSSAFVDTTAPRSNVIGTPRAPDSKVAANKIALTYHTIVPGELKMPTASASRTLQVRAQREAGPPKLVEVEEEISLEDEGPPRRPPVEEEEELPPVRRVPKGLPTETGVKRKVLLAR